VKHDRFKLEEEILAKLVGHEGFPQISGTGEIDDHSMLIMQILGENLRSLKD
jgi:predicted Ser/Thr protein kinase